MISTIVDSGLRGLSKSLQGAEQAATDISRAGLVSAGSAQEDSTDTTSPLAIDSDVQTDLSGAMVELKLYEQSFAASSKVVSVADDLLGTLLDTTA